MVKPEAWYNLAEIAKQIPLIESNEEDSLKLELRRIKDLSNFKKIYGPIFLYCKSKFGTQESQKNL